MAEKVWKRFDLSNQLVETSIQRKSWLDLAAWFKYINQDLDNVHNSPDEIKEINRKKAEWYIWEPISTKEISDKEIDAYIDWLTDRQAKWLTDKAQTDEYDINTLFAYINNWDSWKDPYAEWTGMYEKKWASLANDVSNSTAAKWIGWWALWELWWYWIEKFWKRLYNSVTPYAKDDVPTLVSNANAKPLMDKIDSEIARIWEEIETLKAKWWSEEEIQKLQNAYDQLLKQKNSRSTEPKQTIRDFVREEWYAWSNMNITKDLDLDKDTLWITDIEEKMAMSNERFKKSDILSSLTREDFWVSEAAWEKEYKPIIDEYIEFYSNKWDDTLLSLQEWKNEIWKTFDYNEMGEKISSTKNNIKSRVQDKIWDTIKNQLETEYPWQWMSEKVTKYWKLKEAGDEFIKRWSKEVTKVPSKTSKAKKWYKRIELNDWQKRTLGGWMERIWKLRPTGIWNYVKGNKKLMALIWLWSVVLKNPVAQAGLTALEVAWDVDMANDAWNFIDDYRKFAPKVQRIHARFSDGDTRIWWEFAWMSEEEKEKAYSTEEVLKDLQWLSDNWYEDFLDTYFQYNMPDFLWWKSLKLADFDDLWDYVWWRLKNEEEDLDPVEKTKRKLNWKK